MVELLFIVFLVIFGIVTSSKSYKEKTANYVYICPSCGKIAISCFENHVCHICQKAMVATKVKAVDWQKMSKREKTKVIDDFKNSSFFTYQEEYQSKDIRTTYMASEFSAPLTVADQLRKYKNLLDSGAITEDEYELKKRQLLNL